MDIKINDKSLPKSELLELIKTSKLRAVIHIRNIVNISLNDAKNIVDNLDNNPNCYDNLVIEKVTNDLVDDKAINLGSKKRKNKDFFINNERRVGSHFIKPDRTLKRFFIFGMFIIGIVLVVYYLMKESVLLF